MLKSKIRLHPNLLPSSSRAINEYYLLFMRNTLLCISCISNKKHSSHNIKTMAKGIDTIYEQMELSRLKGKEYLDRLEISKRRLEDRRSIIQERWDKTINTVRLHFNNLLELVNRKCDEVIEEYSSFF